VLRIVNALDDPYRIIAAVVHGTGIELSVVLGLKRRHVDIERGEIRAHGTKTKARDRVASIEPWAMDLLRDHARGFLPNAPLFPGIDRWTTSDKHRRACLALARVTGRGDPRELEAALENPTPALQGVSDVSSRIGGEVDSRLAQALVETR